MGERCGLYLESAEERDGDTAVNEESHLELASLVSDYPGVQVNEKVTSPAAVKERRRKKTSNTAKHVSFELSWSGALSIRINSTRVPTAFSRQPHFPSDKTFNSQ